MEHPNPGGIPSPYDYRQITDEHVAGSASPLPASFKTDLNKFGVFDQNQIPACVSHAVAKLMTLWWFQKTGETVEFSPHFLDILSWEPGLGLNDGRRPTTVMKVAKNIGCCTTALLPNDTTIPVATYRDGTVITQEMRDEAAKYKIPGFIFITLTQEAIRRAILTYGGVALLFMIGKEFWTDVNGNVTYDPVKLDPLRIPQVVISGHQLVGNGWDDATLDRLFNSWGEAWNQRGEGTYKNADWSQFITEALAIAEVPQDIKDLLVQLPKRSDFNHYFGTDLELGSTNVEEVKNLQIALMMEGHLPILLQSEFGAYGPKTRAAVLAFQLKNGISLSWVELHVYAGQYFGPKTRVAMNKIFYHA